MLDNSRAHHGAHHPLASFRMSGAVIVCVSVFAALISLSSSLHAHSSGIVGLSKSATGCSCHGSAPNVNGAAIATISGRQSVLPGSANSYTVTVSGGPNATSGGFDLRAESAGVIAGTFVPGPGTQVLNGELTHTNSSSRSWSFQWIAPAQVGTVQFYLIAQACNGNGNNQGDSWNWCGNIQATPWSVTVSSVTGVAGPAATGTSLSDVWPNPCAGSSRLAISLSHADNVRLEIFDAMGHHVITLADGELQAGRQVVGWNGHDQSGRSCSPGCYTARLSTSSGTFCRKLVRAR